MVEVRKITSFKNESVINYDTNCCLSIKVEVCPVEHASSCHIRYLFPKANMEFRKTSQT